MQTYKGGMPAEAVTYYIFHLAKALKKIHSCNYTHGDVKISNCLLFDDGRVLKLSDLDSLKPINVKSMSGSRHFADPRVKQKILFHLWHCFVAILFFVKLYEWLISFVNDIFSTRF